MVNPRIQYWIQFCLTTSLMIWMLRQNIHSSLFAEDTKRRGVADTPVGHAPIQRDRLDKWANRNLMQLKTPSLDIIKSHLDMILDNWLAAALTKQGSRSQEVSSKLNDSVTSQAIQTFQNSISNLWRAPLSLVLPRSEAPC